MKPTSQKDFVSGLMFTAVGIAFAVGATNFDIGSAARMGPGYFPLLLGIVLALLGLVVTLQSFGRPKGGDDGSIGAIAWRPLVFILLANLVFGVLLVGLPSIGLPPFGGMWSKWLLALGALGVWSFQHLPIDATPDIANVQVQINSEAEGYSPLEAEQRITFPLETAVAGLPSEAFRACCGGSRGSENVAAG